MVEIKVPVIGESISEATIGQIFKETGSIVQADEELLEVETEKVNQVIYAPAAGKVTLQVKVDDVVKIGQVIGQIDESAAGQASPSKVDKSAPPAEEKKTPEQEPKKSEPSANGARQSVDQYLSEVGQEKPAPSSAKPAAQAAKRSPMQIPSSANDKRVRMTKLRQTIASKLVEVKNETAMLTTFNEVDMTKVMEVRKNEGENFKKRFGVKLGFMSFFLKATASALKEFRDVHAFIDGTEIVYPSVIDIGVAVGTEKGLFVPVIRSTDTKSYADIEKELVGFREKIDSGSISMEELRGGSFTISNGGVYGSLLSTPIINPPQSAILGMHSIQKRAVVVEDEIVIRPMMYLALSYDHRIIDGKTAIQFLGKLKANLEEPPRLLLDL